MKTAIIGCGAIAASHIRILKKLKPDTEIVLCDIDAERAREFAARWKVDTVYTDVERMLQQARPGVAHILTPPRTHAVIAEQALRSGAHVFVEKPVTETAQEYAHLAGLAGEQHRLLCGGYSTLGMPVVLEAFRLIRSGALGRVVAVHCTFAGSEGGGMIQYKDPNHWAYRLRGGILQNMIDHPLSLVLSALDRVDRHHVTVNRRNVLPYGCPDLMHLSLANDHQVGSVTLTLGHGCNERRAQFILEGGSIVIDMGRQLIASVVGRGPQNFIKKALSGINEGVAFAGGTVGNMVKAVRGKLARDPGIANLMQNFYSAMDSDEPLLVRHDMVLEMTGLLDVVWKETGYSPTSSLTEVTS
jgi:predicted dehydrogenase